MSCDDCGGFAGREFWGDDLGCRCLCDECGEPTFGFGQAGRHFACAGPDDDEDCPWDDDDLDEDPDDLEYGRHVLTLTPRSELL